MRNTNVDDSENEFDVDEPDEIQNNHTDDEWTPEVSGRRRTSTRLRNSGKARPLLTEVSSSDEEGSDDDDDESEEETRKRRSKQKKGRQVKRARVTSTTNENSDSQQGDGENKSVTNSDSEPTSTTTSNSVTKHSKEFSNLFQSGSFVVLKTDFASDGDPPLWKIDGKALLQKYIPFEQDGKTYYKNTSVYSGWTVNNKHQYYPATVVFKQQNRKEHIVEFQRNLIKVDETPASE
ncbi:uncharacterized protein LOC142326342 isoform X2 [Lycorma delicatula]|uniref:uncharacterized protein LOC142326342 isoform X2 n=1 Tax=Lycorma delicatula TaxID=130591 RepID=UPI003F514DA2